MSKPPLQFYHQKGKRGRLADSPMHFEVAIVPTKHLKQTVAGMNPVSVVELPFHLLQDLYASPA